MINFGQKEKLLRENDRQKDGQKDRQKDRYIEIMKYPSKSFNNKMYDKYQVEK